MKRWCIKGAFNQNVGGTHLIKGESFCCIYGMYQCNLGSKILFHILFHFHWDARHVKNEGGKTMEGLPGQWSPPELFGALLSALAQRAMNPNIECDCEFVKKKKRKYIF